MNMHVLAIGDKDLRVVGQVLCARLVQMDRPDRAAHQDKDMLRVGSENVAASEIETVIMETGWVAECAVIGQKHFMLDDMPRTTLDKISKVDLRGRLPAIET